MVLNVFLIHHVQTEKSGTKLYHNVFVLKVLSSTVSNVLNVLQDNYMLMEVASVQMELSLTVTNVKIKLLINVSVLLIQIGMEPIVSATQDILVMAPVVSAKV